MTARLPVNYVAPYNNGGPDAAYTSYGNLNRIFGDFVARAGKDAIWVAIEAAEVCETSVGMQICGIIEDALEIARNNCLDRTPPEYRYIKLLCRKTQNKLFVKIDYTCRKDAHHTLDERGQKIKEQIDLVDGYIQIKADEKQESIRIAVPVEQRQAE